MDCDGVREVHAEFSRWVYNGVDASVAPGLDTPDLTAAAEALGLGRFGSSGSLSVSALVTGAIKSLAGCGMKLCGYSGLMLPILEDRGLARASVEGTISVQKVSGGGRRALFHGL